MPQASHLLGLTFLAALATLLGGWLVVRFLHGRESWMRHVSGMAAGYLVALTLLRLLPESFELGEAHGEHGAHMALWALGGFLAVHLIEHGISPHFHYGQECHHHQGHAGGREGRMTSVLALVGLSLHSFMDGMAITAALRVNGSLGVLVFLGVLLHRVPEGATISGIFLGHGFGDRKAVWAAGTLTLAALAGAFSQHLIAVPLGPVLGIAGGLGLYVACSDLLPQAQKEKGWKSTLALLAGVALFLATSHLAPHQHGG